MLARINREEKMRLAVVCSNPGAIEPHSDHRAPQMDGVLVPLLLLDHIYERLAHFGLRDRMVALIRLHCKLDLVWPAPGGRASHCRLVMRKNRQREKKNG